MDLPKAENGSSQSGKWRFPKRTMDLLKRKYDAISYKEICLKKNSLLLRIQNPNEENHRNEENGNGNEVDSEDNGRANPQFINPHCKSISTVQSQLS